MNMTGPYRLPKSMIIIKNGDGNQRRQYPDYLVHYGISGQKWGIRRFQNEDGTLTEEGKQRYDKTPESEKWKKSDAEHLSDEELRRRNNRLQAERQYKDLTTSQVERERIQRRKDIINKVIVGTAVSLAAVAMRGHWKKAASFIGKFGKHAVAKLRTKIGMGGVTKNAAKKYGQISLNSQHYEGMYLRPGTASKNLRFRPNGIPQVTGPRMYNYRPRVNNSLPKSRVWPRT